MKLHLPVSFLKVIWAVSFFFFLGLFFLPSSLLAVSTHTESHFVTYEFRPDGSARVSFVISLKNNVSNVYVNEYSLTVGSDKVSEIKASDSKGNLRLQVSEPQDGRTKIKAFFNDVVPGKDAVLTWNLSYVVSDFASKNGEVWEISIPKFLNTESIGDYQINLVVPSEFGPALYVSPQPTQDLTSQNFTFTKDSILNKGIHAAFGLRQIYNFSLSYYLSNPKPFTVLSPVPIPADTNYQRVYYRSINPQPSNVVLDEDGNYMAEFSLKAGEETVVKVEGSAEVFFNPQSSPSALTKDTIALYTRNQPYWETDAPSVSQKSKELKTPESIYQYVTNNLLFVKSGQQKRVARGGASNALQKSTELTAIDFADAFVALCRSAGIPARLVLGFAYTSNAALRPTSSIGSQHVWAEYWDFRKGWVPVDPTWGATNTGVDYFNAFDLNHLSFVTYGKSSDTPAPPSSYQADDKKKGGEVYVSSGKLSDIETIKPLPLIVSFNMPTATLGVTGVNGKVSFKNPSSVAVSSVPVTLSSSLLPLSGDGTFSISLPPYGSTDREVYFKTVGPWQEGKSIFTVAASGEEYRYTIMVQSLLTSPLVYILGGLLIVGGLVAFAFKTRRLPFLRSK